MISVLIFELTHVYLYDQLVLFVTLRDIERPVKHELDRHALWYYFYN